MEMRRGSVLLPIGDCGGVHTDLLSDSFLEDVKVEPPFSDVVSPGVKFGWICKWLWFLGLERNPTEWQRRNRGSWPPPA